MADVIMIGILLVIVGAVVACMIRSRKKCGNCAGCPEKGSCACKK